MTIFLFSLTGIPLFAGFIGKFWLFGSVIKNQNYVWLAILGVINSVLSLYYYAKIVKMIWLEKPEPGEVFKMPLYHGIALIGLALPTIVLGIYFTPVIQFIEYSLKGTYFLLIPR